MQEDSFVQMSTLRTFRSFSTTVSSKAKCPLTSFFPIPIGTYQNNNNRNLSQVVGVAFDSDTAKQRHVVYKHLYSSTQTNTDDNVFRVARLEEFIKTNTMKKEKDSNNGNNGNNEEVPQPKTTTTTTYSRTYPLPVGTYKHYKGNLYKVLCVAADFPTTQKQKHVVYKQLYVNKQVNPDNLLWIRPLDEFKGFICSADGFPIKRFTLVR